MARASTSGPILSSSASSLYVSNMVSTGLPAALPPPHPLLGPAGDDGFFFLVKKSLIGMLMIANTSRTGVYMQVTRAAYSCRHQEKAKLKVRRLDIANNAHTIKKQAAIVPMLHPCAHVTLATELGCMLFVHVDTENAGHGCGMQARMKIIRGY